MTRQHFTPRPYQPLASNFLLNVPRANLWAKPGMGKTGIVYKTLDTLQLCGSAFFPALIQAPLKVAELVWPGEVKKWYDFEGMRVVPILGTVAEREAALLRRGDVYVINYENIPWLVDRLRRKWPFRINVADESTKLKSFRGWLNSDGQLCNNGRGGVRSRALAEVAQRTGRWMNLTGTPATNGLLDLWGPQWFIDHGQRLGRTFGDYKSRWFELNPWTNMTTARGGAELDIHRALADCTMALRPEDWMDIKAPITNRVEVEMPAEAYKQYRAMEHDYFIELGDPSNLTEIEAANALARSNKLLQMASGAVYDATKTVHAIHDAKIEGLRSIINECGGEPVLVGYYFKFDVPRLKKEFPEARVLATQKDIDDWNAGRIPIGLAHPQSLGHGQNLQDGGRVVVFYSHTWDLELRLQFIERIGPTRQFQAGYNRAVLIYDLMCRGTLENEVLLRHAGKLTIQEALMLARATRNMDTAPTTPGAHKFITSAVSDLIQ